MTRSRLVVTSSLAVATLAAALAGTLLWLGPAQASVGPVPPEALALPGDAPYVLGLDVRRVVASPQYQRRLKANPQARLDAFKEIEEKTGLNPERDLDAVVFAGGRQSGRRGGVALVLGRFDPVQLRGALETKTGVTSEEHQGVTVFSYAAGGTDRSMAILDDHSILLGDGGLVRRTLDNRGGGKSGMTSNAALLARLQRVRPDATFWLVGDESVLRDLPRTVAAPGLGGPGASLSLPALQQVVVSGDLEPQLALDITGDAVDEAGARTLADMLRGLIAFSSMQAARRPELAGLGSAFNVTQAGSQVKVAVRITPELLDALQAMARPPAVTPEGR